MDRTPFSASVRPAAIVGEVAETEADLRDRSTLMSDAMCESSPAWLYRFAGDLRAGTRHARASYFAGYVSDC